MIGLDIATSLVAARRRGHSLSSFPGPYPRDLDEAYAIQRLAIDLWPDAVAGWKVGRLSPALADRFGTDRFIGPVFANSVVRPDIAADVDFPMFVGGSAAFEAEYVFVVGQDQPACADDLNVGALRALLGEVRIAIEVAGSPLAIMPTLDSLASVADLGNNNGQILGPVIAIDCLEDAGSMLCATSINGRIVRTASAADLPGGPMTAFGFALLQAAKLGMPLRAGQFVSTGAITGMHWVEIGQRWVADFGAFGKIGCLVVPLGRT